MNGFVKSSLIFLAGAALGAFGYKKYLDYTENREPEYEEIIDPEEVDEIKEEKKEEVKDIEIKRGARVDIEPVQEYKISSVEQEEYKRLLDELKYDNKEEDEMEPEKPAMVLRREETVVNPDLPYNISPEEFEEDDYESDEYTLYADGYITDSYGMPIDQEDVVNTIGEHYMSYFGSYDDDQIWVRNERLHMDFSVIRDLDKFVDVASPRIRRMVGL